MALTGTTIQREVPGKSYEILWSGKPASADYVQGTGYAYTAATFGLADAIDWVLPVQATNGYLVVNDYANRALKVYQQNATTGAFEECPTNTDLSALVIMALVKGR